MRLIFSTSDFRVSGLCFEGFPLLVDRDGGADEAVLCFCVYLLLHRGKATSKATWSVCGYALKDFLQFCEDHGRTWREAPVAGLPSVLAAYRTWAIGTSRNSVSTVNQRLDLLVRFYRFAQKHGYIDEAPFGLEPIRILSRERNDAPRRLRTHLAPDIKLRATRRILRVLSAADIEAFLSELKNESHHLMARLQLATGLRVEELVTFPLDFVTDPRRDPEASWIAVFLDPRKMRTKGSVARIIHIPSRLMSDLWKHAALVRPGRRNNGAKDPNTLFVTERGTSFLTRSVWNIYRIAGGRCGIKVNPHLLRHTYATHTLASLASARNIGSALLYVRDRLGHSSIATTEKYLHHVHDASLQIASAYHTELSALMQGSSRKDD